MTTDIVLHKEELQKILKQHLPKGHIWDDIADEVTMSVDENANISINVTSTPKINTIDKVLITYSG